MSHPVVLAFACATLAPAVAAVVWMARTTDRPADRAWTLATPALARPAWAAAAGPAGPARLLASTGLSAAARPAGRAAPRYRTPRQIAWHILIHHFHWKHWQFKYLNLLWSAESGWNRYATNPYSGAYGIPQAVPGSKMAAAGPRWRSSARTQIRWGLRYIRQRYGTPYWAWENERWYGWY